MIDSWWWHCDYDINDYSIIHYYDYDDMIDSWWWICDYGWLQYYTLYWLWYSDDYTRMMINDDDVRV